MGFSGGEREYRHTHFEKNSTFQPFREMHELTETYNLLFCKWQPQIYSLIQTLTHSNFVNFEIDEKLLIQKFF